MTAPQEKAIREALPVAAWMKVSKAHMPRMRMLNEVHVQGVWDVELVQKSDAEAQLAELRAEVERLRADERRLNFMCEPGRERYIEHDKGMWRVYEDVAMKSDHRHKWQAIQLRWHATARAAIDAALAAKESEQT